MKAEPSPPLTINRTRAEWDDLAPEERAARLVRAGALLASGATDAGLAELRALVADRPTWEIIVRGLADRGLMTLPEGLSIDAVFA